MTLSRFLGLGLALAAAVLAADQASKWLVLERLFALPAPITPESWHPPIEVTSFFDLALVWNFGVSFGLFSGEAETLRWGLSALAVAIVLWLLVWLGRTERWLTAAAIGLVIGGALGNLVDRLRFGAVADFLHVHALGYSFWVFNVADSAISIGVALLVADGLFGRRTGGFAVEQRDRP